MHYKVLMLDLDGTTVPNRSDGMPSARVITAITKAQQHIHVGVVTSRPYATAKPVLKTLHLSGPSIIDGGAQIIDAASGTVLWQQLIAAEDTDAVCRILAGFAVPLLIGTPDGDIQINPDDFFGECLGFGVQEIPEQTADTIIQALSHIPTISAHKVVGYEINRVWVHITHAGATKQHAILELAKLLDITTHEIIGVGDGYNDFPLLMACGLKVAMGNAVADLKAIADFVAPSVTEDGVAAVIEKYVLPHKKT